MIDSQDTVCVIDPDESVHDALSTFLSASGVDIKCYSTAEAFLDSEVLGKCVCRCLLVEADLPGMGSLALVRQLNSEHNDIPIIVLASTTDRDIADQALKAGAIDVLDKPLISGPLLDRLHTAQSNL